MVHLLSDPGLSFKSLCRQGAETTASRKVKSKTAKGIVGWWKVYWVCLKFVIFATKVNLKFVSPGWFLKAYS